MLEKNKKFEQWIHVKITNKELVEKLDQMSDSDERDRSKFVRWLIQQEWIRRNSNGHLADSSSIQDSEKMVAL
jgi:metal-responsive CopG/Arc/MetJ family transcriptional regulator